MPGLIGVDVQIVNWTHKDPKGRAEDAVNVADCLLGWFSILPTHIRGGVSAGRHSLSN